MQLERQLKIARKIRDLTQEELAKELNVSRTTIMNWEKGKTFVRRNLRPTIEAWLEDTRTLIRQKQADQLWIENIL